MTERLITVAQVAERYAICERSVWLKVQRGSLPKPVKLDSCTRWRESDISAHMQSLTAD